MTNLFVKYDIENETVIAGPQGVAQMILGCRLFKPRT